MQPTEPNSNPAPQGGPEQTPPKIVYVTRPMNPEAPHISEEALKRHDESVKKFPKLNISRGEYVISEAKRHPIGLVMIWGFIALLLGLIGLLAMLTSGQLGSESGTASFAEPTQTSAAQFITIILLLLTPLAIIGGMIATFVYRANTFYLTNESVIQNIQTSLFNKRQQTVSLDNIEDASFTQDGILPHVLNYGSIRLSTEGDETTYRFNYTARPKKQIDLLNNAVEAFKMGRPVEG